jgi:hypothetical protein
VCFCETIQRRRPVLYNLLFSLHIEEYRIMSIAVDFHGYNYAATLDYIGKEF